MTPPCPLNRSIRRNRRTTEFAPASGDIAVETILIDADAHLESADADNDSTPRFADLDLPKQLLRAAADLGFDIPTAIQAAAIPALLGRPRHHRRRADRHRQDGRVRHAAARRRSTRNRGVQALVLTPTRELAVQVAEAIASFAGTPAGHHRGPDLRRRQLPAAARRAARPAPRSSSAPRAGSSITSSAAPSTCPGCSFLVLDEADEMLRMGFAEDVDRILSDAPGERQTALFSATMPPAIRSIARKHLTDPVDIAVSRQSSTVDAVRQTYAIVPFRDKVDALTRILQVAEGDATIVFVRTKEACDQVGADLIARGVSAAAMNGDVPQKERERIIERLRDGRLDVLVATDVAARGLDVDRVDLVVNFDAPGEPESYVHRIGRTGRAGRDRRGADLLHAAGDRPAAGDRAGHPQHPRADHPADRRRRGRAQGDAGCCARPSSPARRWVAGRTTARPSPTSWPSRT